MCPSQKQTPGVRAFLLSISHKREPSFLTSVYNAGKLIILELFCLLTSHCYESVFRIILTMPGLVDAFKDTEDPNNSVATCESLRNSYTPIAQIKKKKPGQRIDHILYHPGSRMQVELKSYCQPLPDRVPDRTYSYSDHEAIEGTFVITSRKKPPTRMTTAEKKCVLENCLGILTKALDNLVSHQIFYSLFAIVLFTLLLLSLAFNIPFGYVIIFNILRIFVIILIVYCTIMATIWNQIEKHGILAVKLAIEVNLKQLSKDL